jgi:hypothetical protein
VNVSGSGQGLVAGCFEHGSDNSASVKNGDFVGYLSALSASEADSAS